MESIGQCSLSWCFYSIDVVEIIHGQYLKGFLLSQNRKKCTIEEVFYWEIQIIVIWKQILMLQSYKVSGSKVMWSKIIWVAL